MAKLHSDDRHSVVVIADRTQRSPRDGSHCLNERSAETVGVEDAEDDASGWTRS